MCVPCVMGGVCVCDRVCDVVCPDLLPGAGVRVPPPQGLAGTCVFHAVLCPHVNGGTRGRYGPGLGCWASLPGPPMPQSPGSDGWISKSRACANHPEPANRPDAGSGRGEWQLPSAGSGPRGIQFRSSPPKGAWDAGGGRGAVVQDGDCHREGEGGQQRDLPRADPRAGEGAQEAMSTMPAQPLTPA
ncbi:unnamed protein product [Lepidochelys olivacea]